MQGRARKNRVSLANNICLGMCYTFTYGVKDIVGVEWGADIISDLFGKLLVAVRQHHGRRQCKD
jgi:hypothetical protein